MKLSRSCFYMIVLFSCVQVFSQTIVSPSIPADTSRCRLIPVKNISGYSHSFGNEFTIHPPYIFHRNPSNASTVVPKYIFYLSGLDTTQYASFFQYTKTAPLTNYSAPQVVADANHNGRLEIYGVEKNINNSSRSSLRCYEEDSRGVFRLIYRYPDSIVAVRNFFDPDNDGVPELLTEASRFDSASMILYKNYPFYKKNDSLSINKSYFFPISLYDTISGWQLNDITVQDLNGDNVMDVVLWDLTVSTIWMGKYDARMPGFTKVASFPLRHGPANEPDFISSFVIGDLNNDGETEIICSSVFGNIYLIQNNGSDNYSIRVVGSTGVFNSYIAFKTNDINSNGRPEIWLGGIDYGNGETRIFGYEMEGRDVMVPFCEINFQGEASLLNNTGKGFDLDGDAKEELILELGSKLVILKLVKSSNGLEPKLMYFKNFYSPTDKFFPENLTVLKEPVNNELLILVAGRISSSTGYSLESHIYKQNTINGINNFESRKESTLSLKIFPNPCYGNLSIQVSAGDRRTAVLYITNILGEIVKDMQIELQSGGTNTINWNCTDAFNKKLPPGIYFLVLVNEKNKITGKLSII